MHWLDLSAAVPLGPGLGAILYLIWAIVNFISVLFS